MVVGSNPTRSIAISFPGSITFLLFFSLRPRAFATTLIDASVLEIFVRIASYVETVEVYISIHFILYRIIRSHSPDKRLVLYSQSGCGFPSNQ